MKKLLLLLIVFSSIVTNAQAQDRNRFRIGLGFQRTWLLDKQASPLKYQTKEKTLLLAYSRLKRKLLFNAQLQGSYGDFFPTGFRNRNWYDPGYNSNGIPRKDSNLLIGTIYQARLNIGFVRAFGTKHSKVGKERFRSTRYLGASLGNQVLYTDNIVRAGWLNATTINGEFYYLIQGSNKHYFHFKVAVPLVARNTTLPYHNTVSSSTGDSHVKTVFKQGSRISWLRDFQNIQLSASYEYAVSKKLGLGVRYFGQVLRYTNGNSIQFFQNNIGVVASVR